MKANQGRRRADRRKRKSGLELDLEIHRHARIIVTKFIRSAKATQFQSKLNYAASDPRKIILFLTLSGMLDKKSAPSHFMTGQLQVPLLSLSMTIAFKIRETFRMLPMMKLVI